MLLDIPFGNKRKQGFRNIHVDAAFDIGDKAKIP
jgi:hypothetical protein